MQKSTDPNDYELRDEYDLSKMAVVPKGRYAPERRAKKNVAVLEPDIARAFPTDDSVNEALRLVLQMAGIPSKPKVRARSLRRTKAAA